MVTPSLYMAEQAYVWLISRFLNYLRSFFLFPYLLCKYKLHIYCLYCCSRLILPSASYVLVHSLTVIHNFESFAWNLFACQISEWDKGARYLQRWSNPVRKIILYTFYFIVCFFLSNCLGRLNLLQVGIGMIMKYNIWEFCYHKFMKSSIV